MNRSISYRIPLLAVLASTLSASGQLEEQREVLFNRAIDHERFTFRHQGLDSRLTGVEHRRVIKEILS